MKVLIADKLSGEAVTALKKLNLEVEVRAELTAETLPSAMADVGILVVRSTKVKAAAIQAAPQLSLIIRAGAGYDTIDLAAASSRGIYVANCPGKNTLAVAELAIGMMVAADRRIVNATTAHPQRIVAEKGIRQFPRPGRPHARRHGLRRDRPGGRPKGPRHGHENHHLVAAGPHPRSRPRPSAWATTTRPRRWPPTPTW